MRSPRCAGFTFYALFLSTILTMSLEAPAAAAQSGAPLERILEQMQQHEAAQALNVNHYDALRHYQVMYKGLGTHMMAKMDVDLSFDSTSGKSFRIISQSGSKLLCDKVLRRAVNSEEEASKDKTSTTLSKRNYTFQLTGTEQLNGRPTYVLRVEPVRKSKFLFRGKVWVDAQEYAVVRIEVEPGQNPSFWITSTRIENTYSKTDGLWLPERNRSESKIRIGGTAVLTIDYGTYHVTLASPGEAAKSDSSQHLQ